MKRSKRLEKGIKTLDEEIEFHKEKRERATKEGRLELAGYYDKEILGLIKTKERKEKQLGKS